MLSIFFNSVGYESGKDILLMIGIKMIVILRIWIVYKNILVINLLL